MMDDFLSLEFVQLESTLGRETVSKFTLTTYPAHKVTRPVCF